MSDKYLSNSVDGKRLNRDIEPDTQVTCGNCEWSGDSEELAPIQRIEERLTPGDPVPAGECPACGALAYIDNEGETE